MNKELIAWFERLKEIKDNAQNSQGEVALGWNDYLSGYFKSVDFILEQLKKVK